MKTEYKKHLRRTPADNSCMLPIGSAILNRRFFQSRCSATSQMGILFGPAIDKDVAQQDGRTTFPGWGQASRKCVGLACFGFTLNFSLSKWSLTY